MRDLGDKVPTDVRSDVEAKAAEVKSVAQGEDVDKIKAVTDELGLAIQKIGASVYEQNPQSGEGEAGSDPNQDAGPDVVDGEVKE